MDILRFSVDDPHFRGGMIVRPIFIAAALTVLSCSPVAADDGPMKYQAENDDFLRCGIRQARKIYHANPSVDPYYIAIAAMPRCDQQRRALISAIRKKTNHEIWQQLIQIGDRQFTEIAIAAVVGEM